MSPPGPRAGQEWPPGSPWRTCSGWSDRPAGYLVPALSAVEVAVGERVTRRARAEEAQRTLTGPVERRLFGVVWRVMAEEMSTIFRRNPS